MKILSGLFYSWCIILALAFSVFSPVAKAQRKAVSGAEVTGTFRSCFKGKYKGIGNEIRIAALGKGKLRVAFDLIYPYTLQDGEMSANTGEGGGEATIDGDTATFESNEFGQCKITLKFTKPGAVLVTQEQEGSGCGFGHNVTADGTYTKFSSKKPKFDRPNN